VPGDCLAGAGSHSNVGSNIAEQEVDGGIIDLDRPREVTLMSLTAPADEPILILDRHLRRFSPVVSRCLLVEMDQQEIRYTNAARRQGMRYPSRLSASHDFAVTVVQGQIANCLEELEKGPNGRDRYDLFDPAQEHDAIALVRREMGDGHHLLPAVNAALLAIEARS
jgi:hypothetical protein